MAMEEGENLSNKQAQVNVSSEKASQYAEQKCLCQRKRSRLKLLGTVLKEELTKIATADGDGKSDPPAEKIFDAEFSEWMFTQNLGDEFFKLQPSHLIDGEGFLNRLRRRDGAFAGHIYNKLDQSVQYRLEGGASGECMLQDVIDSLNRLMASNAELLGKDAEEKYDETHRRIADRYQPKGVALSRMRLQAAFPEEITNAWETLSVVYKWIHAHKNRQPTALCLSGGGIRSATFGLGVIQGLAENKVLERFNYISTVSGGGYIGSWLTAWFYRAGFKDVCETLRTRKDKSQEAPLKSAPKDVNVNDPLKPEPNEICHLREFSNYLTPKLGVSSVDTWTLMATYLRNLFLNWCVFVPALAMILFVPRICVSVTKLQAPNWLVFTVGAAGVIFLLVALVFAALNRPSMAAGHRRATSVGQREFLLWCFLPLYLGTLCFTSIWAWMRNGPTILGDWTTLGAKAEKPGLVPFLIFAAGLHVLAWLVYSIGLGWKGIRELFACAVSGGLGGLLLWTGGRIAHAPFDWAPAAELYVCFAAPWFLGSFLFALYLFVGFTSNSTSDEDREWWGRKAGWTLIAMGGWSLLSVLVMFGPVGLLALPKIAAGLGGVSGVVTLVLSHSGNTAANRKEATNSSSRPSPGDIGLSILAPVFIFILVSALSLLMTWTVKKLDRENVMHNPAKFSPNDVLDLPSLSVRLKTDTNELCQEIWKRMSPAIKEQVTNYANTGTRLQETTRSLVKEWNFIIATNLFDEYVQNDLLSPDTRAARDILNTNAALIETNTHLKGQFNRLLLQDIFKTELSQNHFDHLTITHQSRLEILGIIFASLLIAALLLSAIININRFSLHAVYRNRLIRAYLGASNRGRRPNLFTGFDPGDNLCMSELGCRPLHVVNMALNLVAGDKLAWQQRKAESFTATPLHAGSLMLGYRDVEQYATGRRGLRLWWEKSDKGLRVGTAIAISGAAASPNMGYHSSPILSFLMTLFNVRLGAWLGNPGKRGSECYKDQAPRLAFLHLVKEALGMTNDRSAYVYLSDGGHFENLGLYEMVIRRCRRIVLSDAGCDPRCALEDLGNAFRKIRIDLGIRIEIEDRFQISSRTSDNPSKYCAIATIHYEDVDEGAEPGKLLYIKPAIAGNEPKDVFNYKEESRMFPHEPTSDQWFSESQFESYRTLGKHIVTEILKGSIDGKTVAEANHAKSVGKDEQAAIRDPLEGLFEAAKQYLKEQSQFPDISAARTEVVLVGKASIRKPKFGI